MNVSDGKQIHSDMNSEKYLNRICSGVCRCNIVKYERGNRMKKNITALVMAAAMAAAPAATALAAAEQTENLTESAQAAQEAVQEAEGSHREWKTDIRMKITKENDLMMGVKYLQKLAEERSMPLVILFGMGTNWGDHAGNSPIGRVLDTAAKAYGTVVVTAAGNETNRSHHYLGQLTDGENDDYVEIRIPSEERGITMELWANSPEIYRVKVLSPTGESTGDVVPRLNQNSIFQFTMEKSVVYVDYQLLERESGSLLIKIRIADPSPGIWTLLVSGESGSDENFHIWLPMEGFSESDTVFLQPNPDTTLTVPSAGQEPITFGAYNHRRNSLYIYSGRGYTRDERVKPDLVAPGVDIIGAVPGGLFGQKSGTSVAAAHGAGASALLLEWGILQKNYPGMRTKDVKSLMIRGAKRAETTTYPNKGSGYGALDVFQIFDAISL